MLKTLNRGRNFYKTFLALMLPMVLQNLISQSLAFMDTFMVGFLGENELAAVSLANTPFFVIQLLVFGLQSGSALLISQYWGRNDRNTINRIIGIGFYLAGAVTFLIALSVVLFPEQVMSLTSDNHELIKISAKYGRLVAFAFFFNSLSQVYIGARRSMEAPKLGLYIMTMSTVLNTFLNWVLIFGKFGIPALGIEGAALATLIARIIEFIITFIISVRSESFVMKPSLIFRPGMVIFKDFIKYSTPVVLNETLWGFGFSLYPIIMGHMQDSAQIVAAYALSLNIERVLSVMAFGVAGASAITIGKMIGEHADKEDVYETGKTLTLLSVLAGLFITVLILIAIHLIIIPFIYPSFALSRTTVEISNMMLYMLAMTALFRSFAVTNVVGVLRGGGDVRAAFCIDVFPMYFFALPLAAIFGLVVFKSIFLIYIVIAAEEIIKSIAGFLRFRTKRWINNLTRPEHEIPSHRE